MNTDREDLRIRHLFERLRLADSARTPSYPEVLKSGAEDADRVSTDRWRLRWAWVAVPALLVLMLASPLLEAPEFTESDATVAANLYGWQSPTDFLLEPEDSLLLSSLPELELEDWTAVSGEEQ
jgi:hypothetical protein